MNNEFKDDTALIHAAEEANAHGFVTELVNGYNTNVDNVVDIYQVRINFKYFFLKFY